MDKFELPRANCELCGSERIFKYHQTSSGVRIFKCSNCEIQFMNPQYTQAYLDEFYSHYTKDEPHWDEPSYYCHNFYLSLVEKYALNRGRFLDIGCGNGHLLAVARERGWAPIGYDVDCASTQRASKKIGVEILCGDFARQDWPKQAFEVVSMHHVIEHLKSPMPYLRVIHSILREKGIFFLVLPNIHSRSAIFKFRLEKLGIKRKHVGAYYDTSHHLWYFTPRTLKNLLSKFGFEVLYMRSGHHVRPNQSKLKRFLMRNFTERVLWKSTFLVIARKA